MTAFERVQGNAIYTPSELAARERKADLMTPTPTPAAAAERGGSFDICGPEQTRGQSQASDPPRPLRRARRRRDRDLRCCAASDADATGGPVPKSVVGRPFAR